MGGLYVASGFQLGPYELGERLGTGGMAEVYVARRAGPHGFAKRFAVKRILPQLARDPRFCAMFCDEARICAALSHPNIVQVVDFGEHDGELFMAMEYVDGISGAKLLRTVASRGERFPFGAALFIAHEVLRALSFAHEACDERGRPLGIVHRDVSPGNVLIGRAGEVKLTDFGIVRSAFVDRRTYPGELKGKLGYMSPEQVIGAEVDPRSDLFTVGIVLAEMLLARPLFPGRNELDILTRIHEADLRVLERYGADLPAEIVAVLKKALSRDRQARFQSARDFADALRSVARREHIALTDADLVPWLCSLGILPSQSGTHEASSFEPLADTTARAAGVRAIAKAARERAARVPRAGSYSEAPATPLAEVISPSAPSRYHLRLGAGSLLGPLSLPQVLELAATGRLGPNTLVSEDGNGFRPARQIDALGQLIMRPAFRFDREFEERCLWHHHVDRARLPAVLFELVLSHETGLVVGENGRRQKRVYLGEGAVHFVSSTERGELLGARLAHAGVVSRENLARALALTCDGGHRRLGEVLVELGVIRPMTLLRALIEQLETRFFDLLRWSEGELWFVRGEQSGEDKVRAAASAAQLLARGIRVSYSDREIVELLSPFRQCPLARAPGARITAAELALPAPERRAVELSAGAKSLSELLADLAAEQVATPEQALRGIFIGLSAGLIVVPGWPRTLD
jgi:eukaryotic-like serine/threonine-protein kinase